MNKVWQVLKVKGNQVWTVPMQASVAQALAVMVDKKIGAVLIVDGDQLAGIFSERDYVNRVGFPNKPGDTTPIQEVMTSKLITVTPDQSVNECMALMTDHHIRHLPVLQDGKLVGILSIGDVVKDLIEELSFLVNQLENYILGLR